MASLVAIAAGVAVAAFALSWYPDQPRQPDPVLAHVVGASSGVVLERGAVREEPGAGTVIRAGDRLIVPIGGRALLRYREDPTRVHLRSGTEVRLEDRDGGKDIVLHRGEILCDVHRQPADRPLQVHAPHARITVLGTRFAVLSDDARTRITVRQGLVDFSRDRDGRSVRIGAMEWADSGEADLKPHRLVERDLITPETYAFRSGGWDGSGQKTYRHAHDGDASTPTRGESGDEEWFEYDLGGAYLLGRARVWDDHHGDYGLGDWRVSYFDGGWKDGTGVLTSDGPGWHEVDLGGVVAERVRFHGKPAPDMKIEIFEFECYGAPLHAEPSTRE